MYTKRNRLISKKTLLKKHSIDGDFRCFKRSVENDFIRLFNRGKDVFTISLRTKRPMSEIIKVLEKEGLYRGKMSK